MSGLLSNFKKALDRDQHALVELYKQAQARPRPRRAWRSAIAGVIEEDKFVKELQFMKTAVEHHRNYIQILGGFVLSEHDV